MNPSEINRAADDSPILIHKMNKYNFKVPYKVSVEIIEETEPLIVPSELDNREQSSEPTFAESTPTTDICYQNTCNNQTTDAIENCNNGDIVMQPDCNKTVETRNDSQTDSWIADLLYSENRSVNNHATVVSDDLEVNVNKKKYEMQLKKLSKNLVNVLKAYSYYSYQIKYTELTKANQEQLIEKYRYIKQTNFESCRDIVFRLILKQGSRFNEKEFINNTTYFANMDNFPCTYENVESIFKELVCTCYRNNYIRAVRPGPAKVMNKGHQAEQQNLQSNRYNSNLRSISQQTQNHHQYNDITPTMGYGSNLILQQTRNCPQYSNAMQTTCNGSSPILQQLQQRNDLPYSNTVQTTCNGSSTILQQLQQRNDLPYSNTMQTTCNGSRTILQQTRNDLPYSNTMQTTYDGSSSISEQTRSDLPYCNTMQPCNGASSILNQTRNGLPYINTMQTTNSGSSPELRESTRNIQNQQQNSLEQMLSDVPTTCVFKYNCPNYEIRLDVNSKLLDNVKEGNKLQNNLQVHDPSPTNEPCAINRSFASEMSHHNVSNQQEPTRSTSRDSGFISPCNNQINDLSNNNNKDYAEDLTAPYITHVTSLHPDATHSPRGTCYVCGAVTTSKCAGCFKYYYCSNACQTHHWPVHKYSCSSAR